MKNLTPFWQKLIIWLTAIIPCVISGSIPLFINVIALLVCGGFVYLKTESKEVKKSALLALISTAIYTACIMLLVLLYNLGVIFESYGLMDAMTKVITIFEVVKILYFATCLVLDLTNVLSKAKYFGVKLPKTEKAETASNDQATPVQTVEVTKTNSEE